MQGETKSPEEELEGSSDNEYEDVKERLRKLREEKWGRRCCLSVGEDRMKIMAATEATGKFVGDILRHGFPKRQLMAFFVTRALMQNNKNMRSIYSSTQPRSVDRGSSIPF
ncbi:unnamed protein product [Brassica oleracea]